MKLEKCTDRFSETQIDDEVVLMLLETGEFLSITGTGCEIWQRIDASEDRQALIAALAATYDANENVIAADVDDFLTQLKTAGVISER